MIVFGQRARQGGCSLSMQIASRLILYFLQYRLIRHICTYVLLLLGTQFGAAQDTLYPLLLSARTMNICIPAFSTFHRHTILHAVISFHRKLCIRMQGMLDIPCPIQFCCNRYIPIPKLFRYLSKITLQCCIFVTMQL